MQAPSKQFVINLKPAIERIERMTSSLLQERVNFGNSLLDGDDEYRNLNEECKYPDPITLDHLYEMYRRELGNRVVNVWPEETWATEPEMVETDDPKDSPFETAAKELIDRVQLWYWMSKVDELSGIGHYGVLFKAYNDGNDPKTPLYTTDRFGKIDPRSVEDGLELMFLRAFDEKRIKILETEKDKKSHRYGQPVFYGLEMGTPSDATTVSGSEAAESNSGWVKVHHTRCQHVAEGTMGNLVYATPRQEPVYNRLHDLRKIAGGSGEMFYRGAFPGISFEMLPELIAEGEFSTESLADLRDQVEQYMQGIRRYLSLRGMTAKSLSPQVADPSKHIEEHLRLLCATIKVPMRIFLGSEAGQMAGDQDQKNWHKRIGTRKRTYVNPWMIRRFFDEQIGLRTLPKPKRYEPRWSDPETVSDKDQADIVMKRATALLQYVSAGGETVYPIREWLVNEFGLTVQQAETIMTAIKKQGKKYLTPGAKAPQEPKAGQSPKDPAKKTGGGARNAQAGKRTARKAAGAK
jgi:hypothetical protein